MQQTEPRLRATRTTMGVDDRMIGQGVFAFLFTQSTAADEGVMEAVAHTQVARNRPSATEIRDKRTCRPL